MPFPAAPDTWRSGMPVWWGDDLEEMRHIVLTIGRQMWNGMYQCSLPDFTKDDVSTLSAVTKRIEEIVGRRLS